MCGTSNVDWKALAQTMYMFGMLLGSGVFGWLGDRVSSYHVFLATIFWPDWSKVNADDHFDDDDHRRILSLFPPPNS